MQIVTFLSFFFLETHYFLTPNKPESVKLHIDVSKKLYFARSSNRIRSRLNKLEGRAKRLNIYNNYRFPFLLTSEYEYYCLKLDINFFSLKPLFISILEYAFKRIESISLSISLSKKERKKNHSIHRYRSVRYFTIITIICIIKIHKENSKLTNRRNEEIRKDGVEVGVGKNGGRRRAEVTRIVVRRPIVPDSADVVKRRGQAI